MLGEGLIGFRLALHWSEPKELRKTKHHWQLAGDEGTCSTLQSEVVVSFVGCSVVGGSSLPIGLRELVTVDAVTDCFG